MAHAASMSFLKDLHRHIKMPTGEPHSFSFLIIFDAEALISPPNVNREHDFSVGLTVHMLP